MTRPNIPVWVELICAYCVTEGPGMFVRWGMSFADKLRERGRDEGWVFKYSEAFCCAEHAQAYAEREAARGRVA